MLFFILTANRAEMTVVPLLKHASFTIKSRHLKLDWHLSRSTGENTQLALVVRIHIVWAVDNIARGSP